MFDLLSNEYNHPHDRNLRELHDFFHKPEQENSGAKNKISPATAGINLRRILAQNLLEPISRSPFSMTYLQYKFTQQSLEEPSDHTLHDKT